MITKINEKLICISEIVVHPFFVPVFVAITLQFVLNLFFVLVPSGNLQPFFVEGNLISKLATFCYSFLFVMFVWAFFDFRRSCHLLDYVVFLVLSICAFAREHELLRWVMGRGDVAVNLKFLFDPRNAVSYKILLVVIFLLLVLIFIYLAVRYAARIVKEFFCFGTIAWSFATFVLCFLIGQCIDSLPKKFAIYTDVTLETELHTKLELVEECTEIFMPVIVAIIFVQYHFILKQQKKVTG
ncbi:MAG: hypothetical protein LBT09_13355 [Planctomycetaceae bacterium]|jgi:hypothetical protein|nr:hypothetical protein [Planctomycetaceae bacterium]